MVSLSYIFPQSNLKAGEGKNGTLTCFLHPEGVGGLNVEIGGILIFLFLVAEEAEPTGCALDRLLCLFAKYNVSRSLQDAVDQALSMEREAYLL